MLTSSVATRRNSARHDAATVLLLLFFCIVWLYMIFGPTIYYTCHNATEINATVVDVVMDEETNKEHIYVSYQYKGQQYENIYYRSVSHQSPSNGGVITVKINEESPNLTVCPFAELIYTPGKCLELLIIASSAILLWLCFKTIFKNLHNKQFVDREWVLCYVKRREMLRMVLATCAILLNYIVDTNGAFYAVFTVGIYIILRSAIRIVRIFVADTTLQVSVATCLGRRSEETGVDLDSSTPQHTIRTDLETFVFYGYGSAALFCTGLNPSDKILIVRFGTSADPYMLCRLGNETTHSIKHTKQQVVTRPMLVRLLPVAALVLIWLTLPGMYQCRHVYYDRTILEPSTKVEGTAERMCAKCYESQFVDLPKLEDKIIVKVKEKQASYSEYDAIEIDGVAIELPSSGQLHSISYVLELSNTGAASVRNVTGDVTVYNLNNEKLGAFQFQSEAMLSPGETRLVEAESIFVWTITTDVMEEMLANQLAEADLDELYFDFTIGYE